jgi:hypothetical protein
VWPIPFKQGAVNCATPYDAWGHQHVAAGLFEVATATGSELAETALEQLLAMLVTRFRENSTALHSLGAQHSVAALVNVAAKNYALTPSEELLGMINALLKLQEMPGGSDFLRRGSRSNILFAHNRVGEWQGLVTLEGMAVLAGCNPPLPNAAELRTAVLKLWWSLCEHERKNTGALFNGDKAGTGQPDRRTTMMEEQPTTRATVAWVKLTAEVLKLTGDSLVADELELSLFNAGLYSMSPHSQLRAATIPSDGKRGASAATMSEDALSGASMVSVLPDTTVVVSGEGLAVNLYAPGTFTKKITSGVEMGVVLDTRYPYDNVVNIVVKMSRREAAPLNLRIPTWSSNTKITVDQKMGNQPETFLLDQKAAGGYYPLSYSWSDGDKINVEFEFGLRFWKHSSSELTSIYRGPLLLAFQHSAASAQHATVPKMKAANMNFALTESLSALGGSDAGLTLTLEDGVVLRDYASVGSDFGFATWLPVEFEGGAASPAFSQTATSRTFHLEASASLQKSTATTAAKPTISAPVLHTRTFGSASGGLGGKTQATEVPTRRASISDLLSGALSFVVLSKLLFEVYGSFPRLCVVPSDS